MTGETTETPLQRYYADLARLGWREDADQAATMQRLQHLYEALVAVRPRQGWLDRLRRRPLQPVRGLYLWGGTGRGKTWLVDSFYACLPFPEKSRLHYHAFMQEVHARLQLLCLDEFHVTDIADAMLLGGLLQALFARGITLVVTSNLAPDELYLDGLQRDRFLFAIELLKRHTQAVHLQGEADYRCAHLDAAGNYHPSDAADTGARMREHLARLAPEPAVEGAQLELNRRTVPVRALAGDLAWFDFSELCERPLWAADYLELARRFHTLLLSDVPVLDEDRDDAAKRFMHLIDALYDHNVKLVITAAAPPPQLYTGRYLQFAFQRTASRLIEMTGHRYLARAHRP